MRGFIAKMFIFFNRQLRVGHLQLRVRHRQLRVRYRQLRVSHRQLSLRHRQLRVRHRQLRISHRQLSLRHRQLRTVEQPIKKLILTFKTSGYLTNFNGFEALISDSSPIRIRFPEGYTTLISSTKKAPNKFVEGFLI